MKNIFKYLSICLVMAISFTSCEADDNVNHDEEPTRDLGGYAHLATTSILQSTDTEMTINLFTASGVSVESVEIIRSGNVVGNATINGENATFNSSILGIQDLAPGNYGIRIRSTLSNGNIAEDPFTVTVEEPEEETEGEE